MKPSLFAFFMFLASATFAQSLPQSITMQAPVVNLRAAQDLKSAVLVKLKQLEGVTLLERGASVTIDGVTDFWYKVQSGDKVGYVFGHLTSMKKAGRRQVIKKFESCEMGDYFHVFFSGTDYGQARNNFGKYELCLDDNGATISNEAYIGKKFQLTINALITEVYCGEGSMELCVKTVDTIVDIKLVQ